MLFGWSNAYVFQAGPSVHMNWYGTTGAGSQAAAGKSIPNRILLPKNAPSPNQFPIRTTYLAYKLTNFSQGPALATLMPCAVTQPCMMPSQAKSLS